MAKKHLVFLLLGSNIHPRSAYLTKAINQISRSTGNILQTSAVYESEPWGFEASVNFLNQLVVVETSLSVSEVLKKTQETERRLGRNKKTNEEGYVSRTIDIDILFYDDNIIRLPELSVPHPHLTKRRFVLMPLSETVPDKIHPVFKKTCRQLLSECQDKGKVWKHKENQTYAL